MSKVDYIGKEVRVIPTEEYVPPVAPSTDGSDEMSLVASVSFRSITYFSTSVPLGVPIVSIMHHFVHWFHCAIDFECSFRF